jgi:hypothetical protein
MKIVTYGPSRVGPLGDVPGLELGSSEALTAPSRALARAGEQIGASTKEWARVEDRIQEERDRDAAIALRLKALTAIEDRESALQMGRTDDTGQVIEAAATSADYVPRYQAAWAEVVEDVSAQAPNPRVRQALRQLLARDAVPRYAQARSRQLERFRSEQATDLVQHERAYEAAIARAPTALLAQGLEDEFLALTAGKVARGVLTPLQAETRVAAFQERIDKARMRRTGATDPLQAAVNLETGYYRRIPPDEAAQFAGAYRNQAEQNAREAIADQNRVIAEADKHLRLQGDEMERRIFHAAKEKELTRPFIEDAVSLGLLSPQKEIWAYKLLAEQDDPQKYKDNQPVVGALKQLVYKLNPSMDDVRQATAALNAAWNRNRPGNDVISMESYSPMLSHLQALSVQLQGKAESEVKAIEGENRTWAREQLGRRHNFVMQAIESLLQTKGIFEFDEKATQLILEAKEEFSRKSAYLVQGGEDPYTLYRRVKPFLTAQYGVTAGNFLRARNDTLPASLQIDKSKLGIAGVPISDPVGLRKQITSAILRLSRESATYRDQESLARDVRKLHEMAQVIDQLITNAQRAQLTDEFGPEALEALPPGGSPPGLAGQGPSPGANPLGRTRR